LNVSEVLNSCLEPFKPHFKDEVQSEWFNMMVKSSLATLAALSTDVAFMLNRQDVNPKPTWTGFNQPHSMNNSVKSTIGHLPIIQAPAHGLKWGMLDYKDILIP
jgi:hypothetical protein